MLRNAIRFQIWAVEKVSTKTIRTIFPGWWLRRKKAINSLLRSPHVNKNSQEQFRKEYYKCIVTKSVGEATHYLQIMKQQPAHFWVAKRKKQVSFTSRF